MKHTPGAAEKRYSELEGIRQPYLDRGRECATLTIPSLLPPDGSNGSTRLLTPFQGIGARGLNNLSSKLLLALLPPNSPFFRMRVDQYLLKQMEGAGDPELKTVIEAALSRVERAVMDDIETSGDRVAVFEALKHLLNEGNVLLFVDTKGLRVFHLDRYVVKRDPMGNVLEIITKECVSPSTVADHFGMPLGTTDDETKTVDVYTRVVRNGDMFHVSQEVHGKKIPGSHGSYPVDRTPWIALRFSRIDGEDYGRGFVEEYLGDLRSLEMLTQAIVEGSAAAAKVLFLVDPNGTTRQKTLSEAPSGAIRDGNANDVSVLQLDKFADFRVAYDTIDRIEKRLSYAFMLNSTVARDAERVTAEEIRYVAGELEDTLGGVYSILSQEFQVPYVNRKMTQMQKQKRLPKLPKGVVKPSIVTGMEALGRGQDLRKLDLFVAGMRETVGPEVLATYVNLDNYISRRATAVGIDTEGLIKTKEEIAQANQMAQMQAMIEKLGPNAMQLFGKIATSPNGPQNGLSTAVADGAKAGAEQSGLAPAGQ